MTSEKVKQKASLESNLIIYQKKLAFSLSQKERSEKFLKRKSSPLRKEKLKKKLAEANREISEYIITIENLKSSLELL